MISYPGIRSRDVLWCAQKRVHPCWYLDVDEKLWNIRMPK